MVNCNQTHVGVVNGISCQSVAMTTIVSHLLIFLAGVTGNVWRTLWRLSIHPIMSHRKIGELFV